MPGTQRIGICAALANPFIWGVAALQYWLSGQVVPLGSASSVLIGTSVAGLTLGHYGAGGLREDAESVLRRELPPLRLRPHLRVGGRRSRAGLPSAEAVRPEPNSILSFSPTPAACWCPAHMSKDLI